MADIGYRLNLLILVSDILHKNGIVFLLKYLISFFCTPLFKNKKNGFNGKPKKNHKKNVK